MPTSATGCWPCDLCPSEREKLPRGGGGVGWRGGASFAYCSETFKDHTLKQLLPKLKIMDKDIDLALYRDLRRSLLIMTSRDRFDVKKHPALYHDFSKGPR